MNNDKFIIARYIKDFIIMLYDYLLNYPKKYFELYNVPIGVDTLEEGIPKNWTVQKGIKSLKMDTKLWVL